MKAAALLVLLVGCASEPPPPPPRTPVTPPAVAPAPPPDPCDAELTNATTALGCARAAFDRGDLDGAARRAAETARTFPYSSRARDAEELEADVLAARGDWAGAEAAYSEYLRHHPTSPRVEDVKRKRETAHDRLVNKADPQTGRPPAPHTP